MNSYAFLFVCVQALSLQNAYSQYLKPITQNIIEYPTWPAPTFVESLYPGSLLPSASVGPAPVFPGTPFLPRAPVLPAPVFPGTSFLPGAPVLPAPVFPGTSFLPGAPVLPANVFPGTSFLPGAPVLPAPSILPTPGYPYSYGITVSADNLLIQGPLRVDGGMPFATSVSLSGAVPSSGVGLVSNSCNCGSPIVY